MRGSRRLVSRKHHHVELGWARRGSAMGMVRLELQLVKEFNAALANVYCIGIAI